VGDVNREYYRAKQEELQWLNDRDPIKLHGDWLIATNRADKILLDDINSKAKAEIDAAVEFAMKSPYPAMQQVEEDIYA
jgi:pyruvate dehydrogenase E1 component alpha subunit